MFHGLTSTVDMEATNQRADICSWSVVMPSVDSIAKASPHQAKAISSRGYNGDAGERGF